MAISKRNRQPLYHQVAQELKRQIDEGRLQPDSQLPSEPELARQFAVSRATVREALRSLQREGVVRAIRGQGTFVEPRIRVPNVGIDSLYSITEVIRRQGYEPSTAGFRTTRCRLGDLTHMGAEPVLPFPVDEPVALIERTRLADGRPVVYTCDAVPLRFLTMSDWEQPLQHQSLFDLLAAGGYYVAQTQTRLFAVEAPLEAAYRLEVKPGSPLMMTREVVYDRSGQPLLVSRDFYRTDRIEVLVVRRKGGGWGS